VGVAVNVTDDPIHEGLEPALIVTEVLTIGFTVIVTVFEVAVTGTGQLALDNITHFIWSLFAGV
jgi:hypothetical protein